MGMVENMGGMEELVDELRNYRWVAIGGEIREMSEILDEIVNEIESADTIVFNYNEKVGNEVETQYYRTSWLARYRKTEYAYVLANDIELIKVAESIRFNEDDDWEAVYTYEIKGDCIVIEVDINNFDNEHEFNKTVWITFLG